MTTLECPICGQGTLQKETTRESFVAVARAIIFSSFVDDLGEYLPEERAGTKRDGSVELDATRLGRDAGKIAEEVVQQLSALMNSNVEITLEIKADVPEGVPDNVVRTVTENCRTLKFKSHGFEEK